MIPDSKSYKFNIRELDNRFRISIHERCQVQRFYVGVERLQETGELDSEGCSNLEWRHISGSVRGGYGAYEDAQRAALSLYNETVQKYKERVNGQVAG